MSPVRTFVVPALAVGGLCASWSPAAAQGRVGVGAEFTGYSVDAGLGVEAVQLFSVPLAVSFTAGDRTTVDLYSSWAQGEVEREGVRYVLSGLVDTHVRASVEAAPWALLSFAVGVPTGKSEQSAEEAVVSTVLSTDLLAFPQAAWGTGLSLTSAVTMAREMGAVAVGVSASYAARSEFEPRSDLDLMYRPGNEARFRLGLDGHVGESGTVSGSVHYARYEADQGNGRNLFQPGSRVGFDARWVFRADAGVWTLYAGSLAREHGDLSLGVLDTSSGVLVGDSVFTTASQRLWSAGVVGAVGIGRSHVLHPQVDLKLQDRKDPDGITAGSGWMLSVGGDLPLRMGSAQDLIPRIRLLVGAIQDDAGESVGVKGVEISGTLRFDF